MTIKTSGGKVITKGGKVSCSCCEEPDCCMYPAAGLGVDYAEADLPDAVDVDGASKSRSGTAYGNTTDGVILEGDKWALYRSGSRSTQNCLVAGVVEDQFADTYTVTGVEPPADFPLFGTKAITVTRVGLCEWVGADQTGPCNELPFGTDYFFATLNYVIGTSFSNPSWRVSFEWQQVSEEYNFETEEYYNLCIGIDGETSERFELDTPVASYPVSGGGFGFLTSLTVTA